MELPLDTVIHGKCLEELRKFPDESVDSIVTDVPYGLGEAPTVEQLIAYLQGADLDLGEFMGKDWDIPSVLVWRECFRVLKPGGFLLTFAGTRTADIISIGLRAAGFENRDTIDAEQGPPVLRWARAQGMPKSTDISKEIDKKAGVERKVAGTRPTHYPDSPSGYSSVSAKGGVRKGGIFGPTHGEVAVGRTVTLPSTEEAKQWEGWGTALAPYWEPILVFRKPIKEKTVTEQVLATGTGGINIKASRVKHSSKEDFEKHKAGVDAIRARGGSMGKSWKNTSDLSGANEVTADGRWPSNFLLVHSDACRQVGTKKVPAPVINRFNDGAKPFGGGAGHPYTTTQTGDENGEEEVTLWECHPSCPFERLNKQRDGATRYFANFHWEPEEGFFYVPKPSQAEKSSGLEGEENDHDTVKPIKLMAYLVGMATRSGGTVLDPYCGSGTTGVAAVGEGMHFIGIEKESDSVRVARGRLEVALQARREVETRRAVFDLAMSLESE